MNRLFSSLPQTKRLMGIFAFVFGKVLTKELNPEGSLESNVSSAPSRPKTIWRWKRCWKIGIP